MAELIPLAILEDRQIQAAFTATARSDLLKPMIIQINRVNNLITGNDPTGARARLDTLAAAALLLNPVAQPTGINNLLLSLASIQLLSNEIEQIRLLLNALLQSLKDVKVPVS